MKYPNYRGLIPASKRASDAAKGASRKSDTKPELRLRRALWKTGIRYNKNVVNLPGKPDIVIRSARVAIFCDGDFWHGRDWKARKKKLICGSNPEYWTAKIERNIGQDKKNSAALQKQGWTVLRFWESEIDRELDRVVSLIQSALTKTTVPENRE